MKTYDASLIEVIRETEHYARIYHPAMDGMTVSESMEFLEWIWSRGYRYLAGDDFAGKFMICEKIAKP